MGDEAMADGLRQLYQQGEFTDVTLSCANQTFHAHRVVLAAESEVFRTGLAQSSGVPKDGKLAKQEIKIADVANPEAVKFMLDHFYRTETNDWQTTTRERRRSTKTSFVLRSNSACQASWIVQLSGQRK